METNKNDEVIVDLKLDNGVKGDSVIKISKKHNVIILSLVILIAIISFINGYRYREWSSMTKDKDGFNSEKIQGVRDLIEDEYLYSDEVKEQKMTEGAIEGMVNSIGDIYTRYVTYEEYDDFQAKTSGKYSGIGITVNKNNDGTLNVSDVYKDNNADKAGVKPNDKIIKIDGKEIRQMNGNEAVGLIRGKIGTDVVVTVLRDGKEIELKITRDNIVLPVVDSKIIDNIGYIHISSFNGETEKKFNEEYKKITGSNIKGMIIDLRDNGGGLLNVGVDMASKFIEKGTIVTVERKKSKESMTSKSGDKIALPLVVLVNENTASASEIFSGAIQDYKRGTIVGVSTFGKGLVQNTYQVGEKSMLIITTAKYLTPNGSDINKHGIKPDVEVQYSKEDMIRGLDNQLEKALEVIKDKI